MHDIILLSQQEIVAALTGNAAISAAVEGVFDNAPEQSALPYISLSNISVQLLPTVGESSYQVVASLRYHEHYNGKAASLAFTGEILNTLEEITSSDVVFNIVISGVQIVSQSINAKDNLLTTDIAVELYVDKLGV